MTVTVRIAMWSGPRNISTAMMRSFDNRSDSVVTDEPLYAYYLNATGIEHPMREEVIASQSTDWEAVTRWLSGPIPNGRPVWYWTRSVASGSTGCRTASCCAIRAPCSPLMRASARA